MLILFMSVLSCAVGFVLGLVHSETLRLRRDK